MNAKTFIRRKAALFSATALAFANLLSLAVLPKPVAAASITQRRITMSTSALSAASTTYSVSFRPATITGNSADDIQGIVVEFCQNSPLLSTACTTTNGITSTPTTSTITVSQTGATPASVAFNVNAASINTGRLILTHPTGFTVPLNSADMTFSFTATNPSGTSGSAGTPGTFYARILTYVDETVADDYTSATPGTHLDDGGLALSTANQLTVNARVQEQLSFCVGTTTVDDRTTSPASSCAVAFTGSAGNTVDMGVLDSAAIYVAGPSNAATGDNGVNGVAMVRTNAVNGVVVSFYPEAAGSGTNKLRSLRISGATCSAGADNTDQCFDMAGATQGTFTAGVENFGMTIAGTNCGSTTAYSTCTTNLNANLQRASNYDADGGATYNDGSSSGGYAWPDTGTATTIASATTVVDDEALMLKFAGTASITTPTGSYGVTSTYIATATF
jgi:hypothetical protein